MLEALPHPPTEVPSAMPSRPFRNARLGRWLAVIAWMLVIFLASADEASGEHSSFLLQILVGTFGFHPSAELWETLHHALRKTAHFSEYAILAALWCWALPPGRWRWMGAWLVATLYAGSDEWHQRFVPGRGPSVADVAIDSLGAATSTILLALARSFRKPPGTP